MNNNTNYMIAGGVLLIALLAGGLVFFAGNTDKPTVTGNLDSFAQCLKDKGVTFFGAFWCPHCQRTKAMFGDSAKLLPYVECSNPDGKTQTQICIDNKIESYPTWQFADASRVTGERTLQELSDKSGCVLPK